MQQFFISQGLAECIPQAVQPAPSLATEVLTWYGHVVPTSSGQFFVFMEHSTRYCLVVHEDNVPDQFEQTQIGRMIQSFLTQSVIELTGVNDKIGKRISVLMDEMCQTSQVNVGLDYAISADLFDVACQLQIVIEDLGSYSAETLSEVNLAYHLNQNSEHGAVAGSTPLDRFKKLWVQKLGLNVAASH